MVFEKRRDNGRFEGRRDVTSGYRCVNNFANERSKNIRALLEK